VAVCGLLGREALSGLMSMEGGGRSAGEGGGRLWVKLVLLLLLLLLACAPSLPPPPLRWGEVVPRAVLRWLLFLFFSWFASKVFLARMSSRLFIPPFIVIYSYIYMSIYVYLYMSIYICLSIYVDIRLSLSIYR
jgi:hypothetical protein